ncbi:MAG TPA: TetR/AcrR family transcriptional regulator [Pyrinomonadaceae bacterium]|jgi:AcrR family transcriptional regulator|nr:TetR/AcrR family transcriptional regulator [Pyrinomonadaceae bacterium]
MKNAATPTTTREAILDATDRLLARYGYKKMTIDDLAREVGIGKGSVYLHFPSKQEIALSHIDRIIERLKERLREIATGKAPVEDRLKEMLIERVVYRFDSVQHYTQSLNELLANLRTSLLDRRKRYFAEEARILADVIEEGQSAKVFMEGNAFDLSLTLLSATNALLPYSLSVFELGDRKIVGDRATKTADLLIRGLMC